MAAFDCYCALCSGPLRKPAVRFGSKKVEALTKRRQRVELKRRRLAGDGVIESEDGDDMMENNAAHKANGVGDDDQKTTAMDESVASSLGGTTLAEKTPDHDVAMSLDTDEDHSDENDNDNDGEDNSENNDEDDGENNSEDDGEDDSENESDATGEDSDDNDEEASENSSEDESEDESGDGSEDDEHHSQAGSVDEDEEEFTYDPEKLKRKCISWLDRCHVLGFNPEEDGAFISGRGNEVDSGSFEVVKPGHDPNDPQDDEYTCYNTFDSDEYPAYPFHRTCLQVLAKCLGLESKNDIDKDILYTVFEQNSPEAATALSLNYGQMEGPGQFWNCVQGEEYLVCNPGHKEEISEELQGLIPSKLFSRNTGILNLEHKVLDDPLRALSYDVLYEIFKYLSFEDSKSFMQSSWHVFTSTRHTNFWKQMLRIHIFPWFWEALKALENGIDSEALDQKGVFLWLNAVTTPSFGMDGPLTGVANRRRIWNVCLQLAPQYEEIADPEEREEPDAAEAQVILDRATCLHTSAVAYPVLNDLRTISTQFVRSWSEISSQSSIMNTYWGPTGALIGISINFSGLSLRVFGNTDGDLGSPLHIPSKEWVQEIIVSIDNVDMFHLEQDRSQFRTALDNVPHGTACIRGLTVTLTNRTSKNVREPPQGTNKRPFIVLSGLHLIGLTGKVTGSGEICRLGLLQASTPSQEATEIPSYTKAQQLMWNHSGLTLYCHRKGYWSDIWAHPSLCVHRLDSQSLSTGELRSFNGEIVSDMTPWQVCVWASNAAPYRALQRISCFQPVSSMASNSDEALPIPNIVGLELGYAKVGYLPGGPQLSGGTGGPVPAQSPDWQTMTDPEKDLGSWTTNTTLKAFDEASTKHFHIDGPGGEIITEVHASSDMKAFKLYTNRERQCYFGQENKQDWLQYKAEEGKLIVGLVCAFGRLGGWSSGAKMYSHWSLSGLGVLIVASDYLEVE